MQAALDLLHQLVDSVSPLSPEVWGDFSKIWRPFAAKRKEILTIAGEKEKYLYFVIEGVQRVYYFDEQNREATIVFTYAPSFGGVLDALMLQHPSKYYYETLTVSTFLRASYAELYELIQQYKEVEVLVRQGAMISLSGVLERLAELQCFSAEDRFRRLLQRSPHILQLVPHKYLANYLGMDATNFSKLINKVRM